MLPMFGISFNTATLAPSLHLAPPCTSSPLHSLTWWWTPELQTNRGTNVTAICTAASSTRGKGWCFTVVRFWLATSIHSLVTTKILEVHLQISCRQTQLHCPSIDFDFCTKVLFIQKLNRSSSTLDIQNLQNSSKIVFCRITTVSWRIPD